jgi:RNA binding exosome subunit
MKKLNTVTIRVFSYESEDEDAVKKGLLNFIPLDIEKEKIDIERTVAKGDEGEEDIAILQLMLVKEKHTNTFLKFIGENLSQKDKETILRQAETRLDEELNFFIRLNKEKIVKEQKYELTTDGECYHIRMNIAAFPHKREKALETIREIFK